jgi:hypothetical protein
MSGLLDPGPIDQARVDGVFSELRHGTGPADLDDRIARAGLSLADKIALFKKLCPSGKDSRLGSRTGEREELGMERILLSLAPDDLCRFKFVLEYDGDYKDLEEYVFHDIDDSARQERIVEHIRKTSGPRGIKVLTDVDDTMYPNFLDKRYPRRKDDKRPYPGVVEFYGALMEEPFGPLTLTPVTTLSARPNPVAGALEETSLRNLRVLTGDRLMPSGLSGSLGPTIFGGFQDLLRAKLEKEGEILSDDVPHDKADDIGRVKFENFSRFSRLYPEYRYVFVGDSGQADALTATLMLTDTKVEGTTRVITTFLHDLRRSDGDTTSTSPTFRVLAPQLRVDRNSQTGRGVIVFRNYIEAAVIAHGHAALQLVTAEELARITLAALRDFQAIRFDDLEQRRTLAEQYRANGEEAFRQVTVGAPGQPKLDEAATEIRRILDAGLGA